MTSEDIKHQLIIGLTKVLFGGILRIGRRGDRGQQFGDWGRGDRGQQFGDWEEGGQGAECEWGGGGETTLRRECSGLSGLSVAKGAVPCVMCGNRSPNTASSAVFVRTQHPAPNRPAEGLKPARRRQLSRETSSPHQRKKQTC